MNYTVEKIEDGVATFRYPDNSYAFVVLSSDMSAEDVDDLAHQYAPKTGEKPSFLNVGGTRTAAAKPEAEAEEDTRPAWLLARIAAYGTPDTQLEYITENGLEAWQTHVTSIKTANPKTT